MIFDRNVKLDEFLFAASYAIFMIMNTLRDSFFSNAIGITLYKLAILGAGVILLIKESLQEANNSKTFVQLLLCAGLSLMIIKNSSGFGQHSVAYFIFYIFCARTIPFKKVLRYSLIISSISLGIVVLSSQAGIIRDYVAYDGGRNRHYLGFLYALYPSTMFFNILGLKFIDGTNTRKDMITWIILSALTIWIFIMTDSRTCFAMSVIIIIFHLFLLLFPHAADSRLLRWCMILSVLIFCFVSIGLTISYDSSVRWMNTLNRKLAKRLYYGQNSIEEYGIKLFGQKIKWTGNGLDEFGMQSNAATNYVDCMYIRIVQKFGAVFFVIWLYLMTRAMKLADQHNHARLMIFCTMVAAHCMIDDLSMYLHYNSTWLLMGMLLMRPEGDRIL